MITNDLQLARVALEKGEVVAIPTETVYGLAANALNETAVLKIFEIKGRPLFNPLIVHIKSTEYLSQITTDVPPIAFELAQQFWPGSLTMVLPKKKCIPNCVTANKDTVAVRVPSHSVALELLNQLDFPLAAPSANPFGYISPTTSKHVENQLGKKIKLILEGGPCDKGIESTIIGFENNEPILYRVGAISKERIETVTGPIKIKSKASIAPDAPGMLSKHYAPKTKFILSNTIETDILKYQNKKVGFILFSNSTLNLIHYVQLTTTQNLDEAAKNLYAAMHYLDEKKLDLIIAEEFPYIGIGVSLNDRLQRAQETDYK